MSIDNTSISGRTRAEDPRLREVSSGKKSHRSAGPAPDAHDADRVQLSGLTNRISNELQSGTDRRAERVKALARQVKAGEFQPDIAKISKALIQESLDLKKP